MKEVTATISNKQLMPTHSGTNLKYKIDPPDYITLDGGKVVAGMIVTDIDRNLTNEQKKNPQRLEIENIGGYEHIYVRWMVRDGTRFTVKVQSTKGGSVSAQSQ